MKNMTFKKSAASIAVAAALGAVGTSVQAVNIADDGVGQVVLFPYYTVRGTYDNYINVTNTSDDAVVFKLRFREAHNSEDVRDFNIILSPYDVWTGVITRNADDTAAQIRTRDNSCTSPNLPELAGTNGARGIDFTNVLFNTETPGGLDRTKEGYYEIIEMGRVAAHQNDLGNNEFEWELDIIAGQDEDAAQAIFDNSLHAGGAGNNTQTPGNCLFFHEWAFLNDGPDFNDNVMKPGLILPQNNLKANATLINVSNGNAAGIDPTILANFVMDDRIEADGSDAAEDIASVPFDDRPNFIDATTVSVVTIDDADQAAAMAGFGFTGTPGETLIDRNHTDGHGAVIATLNHATVINEFVSRDNAASEWVITFPGKNEFVNTNPARAPFSRTYTGNNGISCDDIELTLFDREEFTFTPDPIDDPFSFSPPQFPDEPETDILQLCYEVNTIAFNIENKGDGILLSPLEVGIPTDAVGDNGWMRLNLAVDSDGDDRYTSGGGLTSYFGLPAIGFLVKTLSNGVVDANLRSYMMTWEHGYSRVVSSSVP